MLVLLSPDPAPLKPEQCTEVFSRTAIKQQHALGTPLPHPKGRAAASVCFCPASGAQAKGPAAGNETKDLPS